MSSVATSFKSLSTLESEKDSGEGHPSFWFVLGRRIEDRIIIRSLVQQAGIQCTTSVRFRRALE